MSQLHCIKPSCVNPVPTEDTYCESCLVIKTSIADQIDAKFNTTGQEPSGLLAAYDAARGNRAFPLAKDLGFRI